MRFNMLILMPVVWSVILWYIAWHTIVGPVYYTFRADISQAFHIDCRAYIDCRTGK